MNIEGSEQGPIINSRHHGDLPRPNRGPYIIVVLIVIVSIIGSVFYFTVEKDMLNEIDYVEEAWPDEEEVTEPVSIQKELEELKDSLEGVVLEAAGTSPEFFYERALKKEDAKDYEGADEDYTQTIKLAKRYSNEMFNALNNRGVIRAEQFKNYKQAKKDFNKIIEIETNRNDGKSVDSRLEAGYTNRAYVKKMLGDNDGACDDLYNALGLGIEKSTTFIEKQIEKNCW